MPQPWHALVDERDVASPALLVYPDRIEENLRRMVARAGSADRLRPHFKTQKLPHFCRGTSAFLPRFISIPAEPVPFLLLFFFSFFFL